MTRLLTRCLGLIPSLVVAIAVGRAGISTLLVASQVVLSIVLPFVTLPLIYLTSSKRIMTAQDVERDPSVSSESELSTDDKHEEEKDDDTPVAIIPRDLEAVEGEKKDFSNGRVMIAIGVVIWVVIAAANVYAIAALAMGEGD